MPIERQLVDSHQYSYFKWKKSFFQCCTEVKFSVLSKMRCNLCVSCLICSFHYTTLSSSLPVYPAEDDLIFFFRLIFMSDVYVCKMGMVLTEYDLILSELINCISERSIECLCMKLKYGDEYLSYETIWKSYCKCMYEGEIDDEW